MKKRAILFSFLLLIVATVVYTAVAKLSDPKIYDCFLFYNEFELLDIRLRELYDKVDKFVLVEACETFRGKPKEFLYAQNKKRFEKFADKIIYIPIHERLNTQNPWERERYQRNQILKGLAECNSNDIILISDADEIISAQKLSSLVTPLKNKKVDVVVAIQKMYNGYLNRFQGLWQGTVAVRYKDVGRLSLKKVRRLRNLKPRELRKTKMERFLLLPDAGWHFTSMGGVDRFITKIESFSHAELDTAAIKNRENILNQIRCFPCVEIDHTYPLFVQEHMEELKQMGFIDDIN